MEVGGINNFPPFLNNTVTVLPKILCFKSECWLSWWCSGWESACWCRGHRFVPQSGKIPHAVERLGPWAVAAEPARLEPVLRNGRGHNSERPAYRKKKREKLFESPILLSNGHLFYCGNILNGCSYRSSYGSIRYCWMCEFGSAKEKEFGIPYLFLNWRTCKKHAYNFLDLYVKFWCITFASYRMQSWYFCCYGSAFLRLCV